MARVAARPPTVLICNMFMLTRSGTEVVTIDFANGLARRGWRVIVYSAWTGEAAEGLSGDVELVTDLTGLAGAPDLIHGHQHPTLAIAMARFPGTPALQICHDARYWWDGALPLPDVRLYAAVDAACRARFARELDCDPARITLLPNAIDLARCRPRAALPTRPERVLIVANRDAGHVAADQTACDRAGLEHRAVGYGVGAPAPHLEAEMAWADVVVGAARIALEAMAVGCAALVCDARGLAGMARSGRFDDWRGWNFGHRLLTAPVTADAVASALLQYDADDAAVVSARVRVECGLEPALDRLEAAYAQVLTAARARPADPEASAVALARYLRQWLPPASDGSEAGVDAADWRRRAHLAEVRLDGLLAELGRRGLTVTFNEGTGDA
jgi:hypothetical protein